MTIYLYDLEDTDVIKEGFRFNSHPDLISECEFVCTVAFDGETFWAQRQVDRDAAEVAKALNGKTIPVQNVDFRYCPTEMWV